MKFLHSLVCLVCFLPLINGLSSSFTNSSFNSNHLAFLKCKTRELFNHGWDSYMNHGFPHDEIKPISCIPYSRDDDLFNIHRNDVLGNYSLTLLDTITTFAIMEDIENFTKYIELIYEIDFNKDSTVQVFETTIRALGSLLSAHLYAQDKFHLANYDGFLLRQAYDLGKRLLPAYQHASGIPLARVNLSKGSSHLPHKLSSETCSAGAASPFFELTLLSILTNDTTFETYSKNAFMKIWNSKSKLDLIPMSMDPIKGIWLDSITGVGASIDSFYEYALKGSILFNDDELMEIWRKSFNAISTHSKFEWFFGNVHVDTGLLLSPWIDALGAFFPGLLVLAGNIKDAQKAHLPYMKLWNQYQGIPERWDFLPTTGSNNSGSTKIFGSGDNDPISLEWYPLRPEFIESTYHLYRATKDPIYLRIGEQILKDYETSFKVDCGFAGFRDVRTKELQDRMESFVLSETFMYLYLLFDEKNPINNDDGSVFSTEGHPLWIPKGGLRNYKHHKKLLMSDFDPVEPKNETDGNRIGFQDAGDGILNQIYHTALLWSREKIANIIKPTNHEFLQDDGDVGNSDTYNAINLLIDLKQLETCEVPPQDSNLFSNLMSDLNLFTIDSKFYYQWKLKPNTFELDSDFYKIHTIPNGYCQREPTTKTLEFLVGERSEIPNVQLEKIQIKHEDSRFEDIYLDSLNGLRLKVELLTSGSVDKFNQDIDVKFLYKYQMGMVYDFNGFCNADDEMFANSVFRIQVINGVAIDDASTMIYLPRESLKYSTIGSISATSNGYIKIDNVVVVNMRVLDI